MNKKIYNTPVVTITKWMSEDIITTSGGLSSSTVTLASDTEVTGITSVSYKEIDKTL